MAHEFRLKYLHKKAVTHLETNTSPGKWWLENEMCLQHSSFSRDPLVYSLTTWDVSCPSLRMLAGNCDIFSLGKAIPINLHLPLLLAFCGNIPAGGSWKHDRQTPNERLPRLSDVGMFLNMSSGTVEHCCRRMSEVWAGLLRRKRTCPVKNDGWNAILLFN